MADAPVTDRPRTMLFALCLIAAPLIEIVEEVLSPLTSGSNADDFAAIAASPGRFTVSVLFGLLGTCLLLPALLGLAHRSSERSPRLSLVASVFIVLTMLGFAGVRMSQAFELQLATSGDAHAVAQFESALSSPIGLTMSLMFLVGNVVGIILLAIALWRSHRVPIAAIVLFLMFPIVDMVIPGQLGPIVAHVILLAAFSWMAVGFLQSGPARGGKRVERLSAQSSGAATLS